MHITETADVTMPFTLNFLLCNPFIEIYQIL